MNEQNFFNGPNREEGISENLRNSFEIDSEVYVVLSGIGEDREEKGIVRGHEIFQGKIVYNIEILSNGELVSCFAENVSSKPGIMEELKGREKKEKLANMHEKIANARDISEVLSIIDSIEVKIKGSDGVEVRKERIQLLLIDIYSNFLRYLVINNIGLDDDINFHFDRSVQVGEINIRNLTNGGELKIRDGFKKFLRKEFDKIVTKKNKK